MLQSISQTPTRTFSKLNGNLTISVRESEDDLSFR